MPIGSTRILSIVREMWISKVCFKVLCISFVLSGHRVCQILICWSQGWSRMEEI